MRRPLNSHRSPATVLDASAHPVANAIYIHHLDSRHDRTLGGIFVLGVIVRWE